jgi:hypothetical protein
MNRATRRTCFLIITQQTYIVTVNVYKTMISSHNYTSVMLTRIHMAPTAPCYTYGYGVIYTKSYNINFI